MLRFLFQRPIATLSTTVMFVVLSALVALQLPVSLLPDLDVPQLVVKVYYPQGQSLDVEQSILKPIRDGLLTMHGVENLESRASNGTGEIKLYFNQGTSMELAYIEANEKVDQLKNLLPRDMERPQITRLNTSDIPVLYVHIVPKDKSESIVAYSDLAEKTIKKRFEQLKGVSVVDINGLVKRALVVKPDVYKMSALGLKESDLQDAIMAANKDLGAVKVHDGQFRYFLQLSARLKGEGELGKLPLRSPHGISLSLSEVAVIKDTVEETRGMHWFQGQRGIAVSIHKQGTSRMGELMPTIYETVAQLQEEYPTLSFTTSRDQSVLLDISIQNLLSSVGWGSLFAFLILFFFLGEWRVPIVIGISLPVSIIVSAMVFYVVGLSINIISLSGIVLGVGMLVDNGIIVLDHIDRKLSFGYSMFDACVEGTEEMVAPLIGSVLTTLAVFAPLTYLSGISGALFYDQAVGTAAVLGISLVVSFVLLPLVYLLMMRKSKKSEGMGHSRAFSWVLHQYDKSYQFNMRYPRSVVWGGFLLFLLPLGLVYWLPVQGLPSSGQSDTLVDVAWHEPIGAMENVRRIEELAHIVGTERLVADIGVRQWLLHHGTNSEQLARVFIKADNERDLQAQISKMRQWFATHYPSATFDIKPTPNAFNYLFATDKPEWEIRWKGLNPLLPVDGSKMEEVVMEWEKNFFPEPVMHGEGMVREGTLLATINTPLLAHYGVSYATVLAKLQTVFGRQSVADIRNFGERLPIQFTHESQNSFKEATVLAQTGTAYPLSLFISFQHQLSYQNITADKTGIYHSIALQKALPQFEDSIRVRASEKGLLVNFEGQYFQNQAYLYQLAVILGIATLLLYFILVAQFESLWQPLIVLVLLPLGVGGSLLTLWLGGQSLNIMAGIGLVVVLGVMVNDAILKLDTINRYIRSGEYGNLDEAIHHAGLDCLRPILMTTLTTVLALVPILFSEGLGADLQKPLALAVIGGLGVGTVTAAFLVPLMFRMVVTGTNASLEGH